MDKKSTYIVIGIAAAIIVAVLASILIMRSCGNSEELVPTESTPVATVSSASSGDGQGNGQDATDASSQDGDDPSAPSTEFGEIIITIDPSEGGSGNGGSGSGSGSGSGTTTSQGGDATDPTSASSDGTTESTNGVIELPFVPADQL